MVSITEMHEGLEIPCVRRVCTSFAQVFPFGLWGMINKLECDQPTHFLLCNYIFYYCASTFGGISAHLFNVSCIHYLHTHSWTPQNGSWPHGDSFSLSKGKEAHKGDLFGVIFVSVFPGVPEARLFEYMFAAVSSLAR